MTRRPCPAWAAAVFAALTVAGCVEKPKEDANADTDLIAAMVSSRPPTPQFPLNVAFEGKVTLLGYDLEAKSATPGEPFDVVWYWKCEAPLERGWRIFTHVADARGESRLNADRFGPMREAYPPEQWKAGQFIRDPQSITLPTNWASPSAKLLIGLWNGPHRLQVTRGDADGENRARVLTIPVTGQPLPDTVPEFVAQRVTGPITIDGQLDEADWKSALPTAAFINPMTAGPGALEANARVLFDDEFLYVAFEVKDSFLRSTFVDRDSHLWEQDAVEVMIDRDGTGQNYFEIQVSPAGVIFDTRYDTIRQPRPFGDVAWSSQAKATTIVRGTLNDDAPDEGYVVEMALPWAAFATGPTPLTPPMPGSTLRMNFYVMDAQAEGQRAVAWSAPRVPDFHTPSRFGTVRFGDAPSVAPEETTVAPTNAALIANPAARNTPPTPRQAGAGRTPIELEPAAADALRSRAVSDIDPSAATPQKAPAQ